MTTNVIKKIGASNSPTTMDYSTLAAWAAAIPDVVSLDEQWIGEVYNQGVLNTPGLLTITGISGDATHRIILRAAAGHGFQANPSAALCYNASNGAAISASYNYNPIFMGSGTMYLEISGLQFYKRGSQGGLNISDGSAVAFYCHENILDYSNGTGISGATQSNIFENCLVIDGTGGGATMYGSGNGTFRNNTVVSVGGSSGVAIQVDYNVSNSYFYNNACFGFTNALASRATGASSNNITDVATWGANIGASPGTLSVAYSTANFNNITSGSEDFKIPSGSALVGAGSNTNGTAIDIYGTTRPQGTNSDVGCYEFPIIPSSNATATGSETSSVIGESIFSGVAGATGSSTCAGTGGSTYAAVASCPGMAACAATGKSTASVAASAAGQASTNNVVFSTLHTVASPNTTRFILPNTGTAPVTRGGPIGMSFYVPAATYITSVSLQLNANVGTDSTSANVYLVPDDGSGGAPGVAGLPTFTGSGSTLVLTGAILLGSILDSALILSPATALYVFQTNHFVAAGQYWLIATNPVGGTGIALAKWAFDPNPFTAGVGLTGQSMFWQGGGSGTTTCMVASVPCAFVDITNNANLYLGEVNTSFPGQATATSMATATGLAVTSVIAKSTVNSVGTTTGIETSNVIGNSTAASIITGFSRGSPATYFDNTGTLQTAAINVERFTYNPTTLAYLGPLIETSSINGIRNPRGEGGTVGTIGSGGVFPTNWSTASTLSVAMIGNGFESGIPYTDIRCFGTSTGTNFNILPEFGNVIPASVGQTWTHSAYYRLVGGSWNNVTSIVQQIKDFSFNAGAGLLIQTVGTNIAQPTSSGLATQRTVFTWTLPDATVAFVRPAINFIFANGIAIDLTIRIGGPQLEQQPTASSLILPTIGSPIATTRAADITTGLATTSGISQIIATSIAVSTGIGTSSFVGTANDIVTATAIGGSITNIIGQSIATSVATSNGIETSAFVGTANENVTATAIGSSITNIIGQSITTSVATSSGTETSSFISTADKIVIATAIGGSSTNIVGQSIATSIAISISTETSAFVTMADDVVIAIAVGGSSINGIGQSITTSVAVSSGTETSSFVTTVDEIVTATAIGGSNINIIGMSFAQSVLSSNSVAIASFMAVPIFPLSDNYVIISTASPNDYYLITSNMPQVFPFLIQRSFGGSILIAQVAEGMQDGSLVAWLSTTPLGMPLYGQYNWLNPVFVVRNRPRMVTLYDQNIINLPPGALALDPTVIYFVNIKNNQAKSNAFKLIIQGQLV